ncbi:hypothetical protein Hanom_Chr02g00125991 [Helianthus anomalus]
MWHIFDHRSSLLLLTLLRLNLAERFSCLQIKKIQKVSLQSSHGQPCTRCNTRRCFNDSDALLCMCIYNYIALICNSYTLYRGVDYDFQISRSMLRTHDQPVYNRLL